MIRDWTPRALHAREVDILLCLATTLYDPKNTGKVAAEFVFVIEELEAWLAAPDAVGRSALRALLVVLQLSPVRHGFGLRTMTSLDREERARYLGKLEADQSVALDLWKSLLGTAYFSIPTGAAELHLEVLA